MADKKISELPDATLPIAAGVKFEAVQGGVNVKVDADDMPGSGGVTSVSGTTNRVTSSGGATPEINIDSVYDATHINGRPVVAATGTVISFAVPQTYGTIASPETGNITKNATGAVVGMVQLLIHALYNSTPTFGAEFVLLGSYTPTETNYIYMELLADGNILTTIRTAV